MTTKLVLFLLTIMLLSCNERPKVKFTLSANSSISDTIGKDYSAILTELEKTSSDKQTDNLGRLKTTISFNVKTDKKKDFENGIIPWANIENPGNDIEQLVDRNKIVIAESKVTIIINYPLTNEYRFTIESESGFDREQLLKKISENYFKLYEEEEISATIKTIPIEKRTTMYNRNQTNGKYGIWGHDITDLVLSEILVYKTLDGRIILTLNIES